jgi:hypothetical protein
MWRGENGAAVVDGVRVLYSGGNYPHLRRMDAAWPVAALVAASVSAQEAIKCRRPTFPRRGRCEPSRPLADKAPHPRKPSFGEAPARPIRALGEGAGTGMPRILLGSKNGRRCLGHRCESKNDAGPQKAIGPAIGATGGDALRLRKIEDPPVTQTSFFLCVRKR